MNNQSTVKLYSYGYNEARTYMFAVLFAIGNLLLPQLFHLVPNGGMTWLPIYFFTLAGAFKYGWRVGLLTAIASPLANSLLFGMPAMSVLPAILTKSALLAIGAGFAAQRTKTVSLAILACVVVFYQFFGSLAEWAFTGSLAAALQDVRMGLPGMALQIIGGYAVIKRF